MAGEEGAWSPGKAEWRGKFLYLMPVMIEKGRKYWVTEAGEGDGVNCCVEVFLTEGAGWGHHRAVLVW